jgi:putative colanic acid biosynthesis acetyltransferase WcaF
VRSPVTPPTADPQPSEAAPSPDAGLRLDRYDNSAFDRGAGRIKEGLWLLCKCTFFLNPFPWPSALRTALLRLFGARLGLGVVVRSGANITFPWRFTAGDHVWIGEDVLVLSLAPVTLGSHVCLSQRAFLCSGSHAWRRETFDLRTRPIVVGDSVWIAAQAFVGAGVSIGNGSVVSAGAVVMENVPENSLVRGNPATIVPKDLV